MTVREEIFGIVAGLLGFLIPTFIFLFIFIGGNGYRVDCINQQGKVTKDWTIRWYAPLPFLFRPEKEGCVTHTGSRVFLNWVGIDGYEEISLQGQADAIQSNQALSGVQKYQAGLMAILIEQGNWSDSHKGQIPDPVHIDEMTRRIDALIPPPDLAQEKQQLVAFWRQSGVLARRLQGDVAEGNQAAYTADAKAIQKLSKENEPLIRLVLARSGTQ